MNENLIAENAADVAAAAVTSVVESLPLEQIVPVVETAKQVMSKGTAVAIGAGLVLAGAGLGIGVKFGVEKFLKRRKNLAQRIAEAVA